jgi:hypothetical protein
MTSREELDVFDGKISKKEERRKLVSWNLLVLIFTYDIVDAVCLFYAKIQLDHTKHRSSKSLHFIHIILVIANSDY